MNDSKHSVMWMFLTIVVFIVFSAITGLLGYTIQDKTKQLKSDKSDLELRIQTFTNEYNALKTQFDEYNAQVTAKRLQIAELMQELTVTRVLSDHIQSRGEYREALVKSIRDMTSTLAAARDELVAYYNGKREAEENDFRNILEDLTSKTSELEARKTSLDGRIIELDRSFNDDVVRLQTRVNQIQQDIENIQARITVVETEEETDGKILRVDNINMFVVINAGSRDGIKPGQRFKVFQYDTNRVPGEKGFIICRTIYDYVSFAQIVKVEDSINPILEGDYIASPLYSRGEKIKIAVVGHIDGYRTIDEEKIPLMIRKLKRDIEEFGAAFSEQITPDLNLVVISREVAEKPDEGVPTPDMLQYRRAKEYRIPIMLEDEFLRYIAN